MAQEVVGFKVKLENQDFRHLLILLKALHTLLVQSTMMNQDC
jgi:hypothetical protein